MSAGFTIVGLGEALFDVFPGGARLGGAPLNVAVHAHQLAQSAGDPGSGPAGDPGGAARGRGVVVSRVGQDDLGNRLLAEVAEHGMTTEFLQTDPDRPTGRVDVDTDLEGNPTYDIALNAAYDNLQFDFDVEDLAVSCDAVCFGTLAQRDAQARNAIYRFLDTARTGGRAFRLFDVNLRSSGGREFYDARILRRSCELATAIKLNRDELPVVLRLLGLAPEAMEDAAAASLCKAFPFEMVVLTRGAEGTAIYSRGGNRYEGDRVSYPLDAAADSVGAGDACSAAILVGRVRRLPPAQLVNLANHMGAYVASQPGATPRLPDDILALARP